MQHLSQPRLRLDGLSESRSLAEEHVRHARAGTRLCSLVITRILREAFSTHLTVPRV